MPLINNPDLGLALKEFLDLTHLPDSVLAPEIVGVIQLADLSPSSGGRGARGSATVGSVAAQRSLGTISSPVAAGNLRPKILVRHVDIASPASQTINIAITGAGFTPDTIVATKSFTDLDNAGPPSAQISEDNRTNATIPAVALIWSHRFLANTIYRVPLGLSLGTRVFQNHLIVFTGTDNTDLTVSWEWTEFS